MRRWLPVALALAVVAAVAIAQRPRGGLSSVSGQDLSPNSVTTNTVKANVVDAGTITASTVVDAPTVKADAIQTHTGGATGMNIATTGSGTVTIGNSTSGQMSMNGTVLSWNGTSQFNGIVNLAAASSCDAVFTGAASANPVTLNASGTNCGFTVGGTGSGTYSFGASGTGATTIGNGTGNVTSAGTWNSSATAGNQFACSGAATCNLASASGQTEAVDCGGGTCTASLGATNATTTIIGRTSNTTTINGNATFGTAGPNLGGTLVGVWTGGETGLATASTNYGSFDVTQDNTNVKFRQVSCTHQTAGSGTAATLAIRNVTDGTTLCSGTYTCTTTANTPTAIFDCNAQPVKTKLYAYQFTTGCGTTQVTSFQCTTEITH